ncbi:MAG TPA: hypothetical protein VND94_21935 [Terriglobia bacterium]|nr:hypothetical protein [Terriglobia bacterium]
MPKSAADNDPLIVVDGIAIRLMIHIVIIHRYDDCPIALIRGCFDRDACTPGAFILADSIQHFAQSAVALKPERGSYLS